MAAVDDYVVDVRRLRKPYGGIERLHGISFSLDRGETFGFLGANGAGKTTTLEILECYRTRDGGEVPVLGADPAHAGRGCRQAGQRHAGLPADRRRPRCRPRLPTTVTAGENRMRSACLVRLLPRLYDKLNTWLRSRPPRRTRQP